MEDRKRSAGDDLAPPTKRQATNGKVSADADMPWAQDLENYQKDAIYRQMLEYKRDKATLESQLKDVQRRSLEHDDHMRVVDAWWTQLLDEVKLLVDDEVPSNADIDTKFPTALSFKGSEDFTSHLASRAKDIKFKLSHIFTNLTATRGQPSSSIQDLQEKLAKLIAAQKEYVVKVDRLRTDKEELSERLETASLRYIKAEKRLDRAKSNAVAKLESQAIAGTGNNAGSGIGGVEDTEMINGIEESEASKTALQEASATVAKQKEQLDTISAENKTLTEQLTAASLRLSSLNEDDYARTDLFKQLRAQHEDVIRRINHLEATNIQLREEAEKYQAERTHYKLEVESECRSSVTELESQLSKTDQDLTRVRSVRDELVAELAMRKAHNDQDRTSTEHLKELISAKDDRISSLEAEVERLEAQVGDNGAMLALSAELEQLGHEELLAKYISMEKQYDAINKEMPGLQNAWKKMQALGSKKIGELTALEDKVQILSAEKAKADQKYFAARKDMDTRLNEVRALKNQNSKSSEIITQLKDVETANRNLLSNLEKQLSEVKQANTTIMSENKKMESTSKEATSRADTLKHQVSELTKILQSKDMSYSATRARIQHVELELEQMQVKLTQAQKDTDKWKTKSLSNQSTEEEMLRSFALCTICRREFKNCVIKVCGHTFCNSCVEDRISNRMRKCPNCSQSFDRTDVMKLHM